MMQQTSIQSYMQLEAEGKIIIQIEGCMDGK
jgi:hypothetical protein